MELSEFAERLRSATRDALFITRELVLDTLPDSARYLIIPNASYDGNPLRGDEAVYPEDTLDRMYIHLASADAEGVIQFLWRHGKVPEWINMTVDSADSDHTYIVLTCCGRYSAGEMLYYTNGGSHPFCTRSYSPFCVKPIVSPTGWQEFRRPYYKEHLRGLRKWYEMPTLEDFVRMHGKFPLKSIIDRMSRFRSDRS